MRTTTGSVGGSGDFGDWRKIIGAFLVGSALVGIARKNKVAGADLLKLASAIAFFMG